MGGGGSLEGGEAQHILYYIIYIVTQADFNTWKFVLL